MRRRVQVAQHDQAMIVEIFQRARRAHPLDVFRRAIGVIADREQLALDQVGLRRLAHADGDVRLAHRQVELLVRHHQLDANVGIELREFAEPRDQPVDADARCGRHLQFTARPLAAVGQLGARGLQLHEHVVRRAKQQVALLGEDQSACVPVKQRDRKLLLQRADLTRHRRLGQAELFACMREAAGFRCGVKDFQLVPIHVRKPVAWPHSVHSAAARSVACRARNRSASSAAMQPNPAAVTAWR